MNESSPDWVRPVLVFDMGAQTAQLIARRVREAHLYSEIVSPKLSAEQILARKPLALIVSGGPNSAYAEGSPHIDSQLLDSGVPILGICYGFQMLTQMLGGKVASAGRHEYGKAEAKVATDCPLFADTPAQQVVWMSHNDEAKALPEGAKVVASSPGAKIAAFEIEGRPIWGVQWHPEVRHSEYGSQLIKNFLFKAAGLEPNWDPHSITEHQIHQIRERVGNARVICGLSGGVDSSVAAALVHRAVG
ncbi:glutamine-hydrolyzing GMP synthase, partial [uncultured Varibaculum sp.]|uniref:glutamine-hydrolyzing GMP synthase n=1 Tax=uncultured Varibaculum sp. TaxID=413896 RepID=UPI002598CB40